MAQDSGYMYMYRPPIPDDELRKPQSAGQDCFTDMESAREAPPSSADMAVTIPTPAPAPSAPPPAPPPPTTTTTTTTAAITVRTSSPPGSEKEQPPSPASRGQLPLISPLEPQSPSPHKPLLLSATTGPDSPQSTKAPRFGRFRHKRTLSGDTASGRKPKESDQSSRRSRFFRSRNRDAATTPTTTPLSTRFFGPSSSSLSLLSSATPSPLPASPLASAPGLFQQAFGSLTSHSHGRHSSNGDEPESQDHHNHLQSQDQQQVESHHDTPVFLPPLDHIVGSSSRPSSFVRSLPFLSGPPSPPLGGTTTGDDQNHHHHHDPAAPPSAAPTQAPTQAPTDETEQVLSQPPPPFLPLLPQSQPLLLQSQPPPDSQTKLHSPQLSPHTAPVLVPPQSHPSISLSPLHFLPSSSSTLQSRASSSSSSSSSSIPSSPTVRSASPSVSLRRSLTAGTSTSKLARLTAAYLSAGGTNNTNTTGGGSSSFSLSSSSVSAPTAASASTIDLTLTPASSRHATMVFDPELNKLHKLTGPFGRSESVSSASVTSLGGGTMASSTSKPSSSHSGADNHASSIVVRNGRAYLGDTTHVYPLPVDLQELHRQSLHLMLLIQIYGTPILAFDEMDRPPQRILDVGCGSGFWSMMCHRHLKSKGLDNVAFVGLDVAPLAPGSHNSANLGAKPDRTMNWRFVQHDIRRQPLPFADNEFDHIRIGNMCMSTPDDVHQPLMEEYIRILRPGGTLELWETDTTVRMLRPHVPEPRPADVETEDEEEDDNDSHNGHRSNPKPRSRNHNSLPPMGVYSINGSTPLSAPLNPFLVEYNGWIVRALEIRRLTSVPCTLMGAMLLQENDVLRDVRSRRIAIPLGTVRWESEGVGGVVTKDGKSYVRAGRSNHNTPGQVPAKGNLSPAHMAIRHTALLSVMSLIQSLEPLLREVNGKSQDEWDSWYAKMAKDLLRGQGTAWGECMEAGVWWCKKR